VIDRPSQRASLGAVAAAGTLFESAEISGVELMAYRCANERRIPDHGGKLWMQFASMCPTSCMAWWRNALE